MKTFSSIFCSTSCWGRQYLNIFYIPFVFYHSIIFYYILVILVMVRVLFSFLLNLNYYRHYTFISPLQETLKQNHPASHNCYSVKNMLKLLAFKWLLNVLLLETEWSDVMLIWWFVSLKFIRSFLKKIFLICFFKRLPL